MVINNSDHAQPRRYRGIAIEIDINDPEAQRMLEAAGINLNNFDAKELLQAMGVDFNDLKDHALPDSIEIEVEVKNETDEEVLDEIVKRMIVHSFVAKITDIIDKSLPKKPDIKVPEPCTHSAENN